MVWWCSRAIEASLGVCKEDFFDDTFGLTTDVCVRSNTHAGQITIAGSKLAGGPFPVPKSRSMRLPHHRGDPTLTSKSLVSGDILHFEALKGSRNVVLSDVVRGGFLGEVVEHISRRSHRYVLRHVATVVGFGTEHVALHTNAAVGIDAVFSEGESKNRSLAARGEPSEVSAEGEGRTARIFQGPVQLNKSLALRILASIPAFTSWWTMVSVSCAHAQPATTHLRT